MMARSSLRYIEDGVVRGARAASGRPIAGFTAGDRLQRGSVGAAPGVGSILFTKLIAEARAKGYRSPAHHPGAQNEAMRALANKFGAHLTFRYGESSGSIDLTQQRQASPRQPRWQRRRRRTRDGELHRAFWKLMLRMYGWAGPPDRKRFQAIRESKSPGSA